MPSVGFFGYAAVTDGIVVGGVRSPVARQGHNLEVVGSNPTPATNKKPSPLCNRELFCSPSACRPKRPADRPKWDGELTRQVRRAAHVTVWLVRARSVSYGRDTRSLRAAKIAQPNNSYGP